MTWFSIVTFSIERVTSKVFLLSPENVAVLTRAYPRATPGVLESIDAIAKLPITSAIESLNVSNAAAVALYAAATASQ